MKFVKIIFDISIIDKSFLYLFQISGMEKLESIIFYTIDKSIRTYRTYAQNRLKEQEFKITIDQWLIIKALMENPGISQQELGEKVFKDNASVTRIIELLVRGKYLERKINPDDRRKSNLKITDSGKKIIDDVQLLVLENRKIALKGISEKDLKTMHMVLSKITENCKKIS